MAQQSLTSMNQIPSHGNASQAKVGNAREGFKHGMMAQQGHMMAGPGGYAPGMAGGQYMQAQCSFPAPPPKRCYCHPAAFTSLDGRAFHRLLDAYGSSTPCQRY